MYFYVICMALLALMVIRYSTFFSHTLHLVVVFCTIYRHSITNIIQIVSSVFQEPWFWMSLIKR